MVYQLNKFQSLKKIYGLHDWNKQTDGHNKAQHQWVVNLLRGLCFAVTVRDICIISLVNMEEEKKLE